MTRDEEVRAVCDELAGKMDDLRSVVAQIQAVLAAPADNGEQEVPV